MMRKKGGNGDGLLKGARREREESMNRKAAALAWLKHGRRGGSKMQNPLLHAPRDHTRLIQGNHGALRNDEESMCAMLVPPCTNIEAPYHNLSSNIHHNTLPPIMHQASRFKAEALALQNSSSSSSSSSSSTTITTTSNKHHLINMTTGQSLALLSLLPHHQSQKCFKNGYARVGSSTIDTLATGAATPWDCGSSLYDSFELLCLSNQLGRCLTTVNAAAAATSASASSTSSSYRKLLKSIGANPLQGPSLQPSYIPRSLYALPQFMIPNYLATKSSKKRSSLIHPIFSIPNAAPPPCLAAPPLPLHSQSTKSQSVAADDPASTRKKTETSGFRRVFNSLLKSLHIKEDPAHQKPKRSNLSEELEKLPKNRPPSSKGAQIYEDPAAAMALNRSPNSYFSTSSAEMASKRSPTSSSLSSAAAMESRRSSSSPPSSSSSASAVAMASRKGPPASSASHHHHFRNEGFRTTSKPPKSVKWLQPGAS